MADTPVDIDPTKVLRERDEAKSKLAEITADLAKLVTAKDKAIKGQKDLKAELNTAKTRVKTLEKRLKEVDAEERLSERDNLKKQCAAAQSAAEKAKKEAAGKDKLVSDKEQAVQKLQRQVDGLGNTMETMQVGRDAALKRESEALTRESTALGKVSGLEEKIKKLQADLATAVEEKGTLEKELKALRRSPKTSATA